MGSKGKIFFSVTVLAIYVVTIAGIGRYSCHCDHAFQIALLGISSKCSCTQEQHMEDPGHCCPCCGAHLITKEIRKDDCCSVKFFLLDMDQDHFQDNYTSVISSITSFFPPDPVKSFVFSLVSPRIKTFQSVFRLVTDTLYEKNQQLIL